jgi:hypothetical protein
MAPRTNSDRGQTLALVTVFMFALLGMCALAVDVGSWYQQKRSAQSASDASALAGAAFLSVNWASAQSHASSEFTTNKKSGDTATYTNTTTYVANDTIQVQVTRPAPSYFAHVFGKGTITVKTTAKATMMMSGGGPMPWGVMNLAYVPGNVYQIYTDNSGPNNGAVRVPAWDNSTSTCTTGNVNGLGGSALYTAQIQGGVVTTCPITINQVISTKTGNNTGPTQQGVDNRCSTLQAPSSIVSFSASGVPTVLQPSSCQLVLLPVVVDAATGASTWPTTGSGDVKVVGFSWWVIKDYANLGKIVDAMYVGPAPTDPSAGGLTPAYSPQLTG